MVTKFGAFYDSTLDRVGDGATFIGIGAFLLTAPDVAYRIPAVIVCMVAILSSLLVSYARARAEGLGLDCKVGIAQRAERILGLGVASLVVGRGTPGAGAGGASSPCWPSASTITVVQRFVYVYRQRPDVERSEQPAARGRSRGAARPRSILSRKDVSSGGKDRPADRAGGGQARRALCRAGRRGDHLHRRRRARAPRRGARPIGSLTQMGTIRLGKRTENRAPLIKRLRAARRRSTTSCSAPGTRSRTTPTSRRAQGRRARPARAHRADRATSSRRSSRCRRCSTSSYVKRLDGTNVKTRQEQAGAGRGAARGHPRLQGEERLRPPGHGLVRLDRDLHRARARPTGPSRPSSRRWTRTTRSIAPSMLYAYAAHDGGRALRQRRAEPHRATSRRSEQLAQRPAACRSAARTSRPARR